MREFFGFGGYQREPEGFFSWQHIVFVTSLVLIMIGMAIWLGLKNRNKDEKTKNKVLIISAILIDSIELFKIILLCFREQNPLHWIYDLPLFLCSIQLITIPFAAFSKGRLREAALDFVMIFGILGALAGTYGAGNIYGSHPVLSFDSVVSGITHCISGFVSLYIMIANLISMKKENIWILFTILLSFLVVAYVVNVIIDYNYMFLMRGDGTPYDIFYNLVNGNKVLYPMIVLLLFCLYIFLFYFAYFKIASKVKKQAA